MSSKSQKIDEYINKHDSWKQERLNEFRDLIHKIQPEVVEEIKWGIPFFYVDSWMRISMAAYKNHVKYNFLIKIAPHAANNELFNNGLDSEHFRAIDLRENDDIDSDKLRKLAEEFLQKDSEEK